MGVVILDEVIIIFALSMVILLLCHRLRIPSIVGFLLTGVLCGPYGFGFVKDVEDVQTLADIGIVMLLFTIGMEFSLSKIFVFKRYFILGGVLQVAFTVAIGMFFASFLGQEGNQALFWGFLLALSSTAIVLRSLEERREAHTPYGNLSLGILIFQDVVAVVMLLVVPLLADSSEHTSLHTYFYSALFGTAVLSTAVLAGHYLIPHLFLMIAKTRSRELFLLFTLTLCFSAAWLASAIGLSLALGAFLAGLLISDSDYKSQAIGNILPLQELFTSFFFVSIGMLLDVSFVIAQPLTIALATFAIFVVKAFAMVLTAICVGMPLRASFLAAFALCQIGEFSFVLSKTGMSHGLTSDYSYQLFLSAALLSMAATPFLIRLAPLFTDLFLKLPLPMRLKAGFNPIREIQEEGMQNHIIIIGYGISGRNLALAASQAAIPYTIIEMNPDTVRQEKKRGEPIFFGDATHEAVLQQASLEKAKAVAVLINDPIASGRVVEKIREVNPEIYLVVRTRYVRELQQFYQYGADDVVSDEFGASIEIFTRVLRRLSIQEEKVGSIVESLRTLGQEFTHIVHGSRETKEGSCHMKSFYVTELSPICHVTASELQEKYSVNVILHRRKTGAIADIAAKEPITTGDVLVVIGKEDELQKLGQLFNSSALVLA
jgi:CPA2 family monovalent cation:H+ antiporter-2